jgi:MoCo/4Fe-4S cofactor protein with predicted Tat translocation signal
MKKSENFKPDELAALNLPPVSPKGREYWRSLNELAAREDFESLVKQEFPRQAALLGPLGRRDFLKLMGASLALAGLAACVPQSGTKILPYTKPPEEMVPGQPLFYASAMLQDGYAKGVLIETTMGRPIKVEGNPKHPVSLGSTDIFMQASLLELYDPDRAKSVLNQKSPKTWQDFVSAINPVIAGLGQGAGLRILTGPVTSPSLNDQLTSILKSYPQAKWVQFSPIGRANTLAGAALAFGQPYEPIYDFTQADVILSLDGDFLFNDPGHLRYSRDFSQRHQPISASGTMSRLYAVECSQTLTGSNADHRLAVKPAQVEAFARLVASRLGIAVNAPPAGQTPGESWLDPLVADLKKAGKSALVLVGERQPAVVHALAYAINQGLGSIGTTVNLIQPVEFSPSNPDAGLSGLVQDLNGGMVDLLVVLDGNPVYTAPADLNFAAALQKAKLSVYRGGYADETAALATWMVPAAHYMEMWGDARAFDGTLSLVQPVIEPLYGGKSPAELLAVLQGQGAPNGYILLAQYWQSQSKSGQFDQDWRQALSDGLFSGTAFAPVASVPVVDASVLGAAPAAAGTGLEIVFEPDETIWDGRFSNNAWMQELPKPLTKLTWDNGAYLNPATAALKGFASDDVVEIKLGGRSVQAPVFIIPGQPDNVMVVTLGYGRQAGGSVLEGAGYNAYSIRSSAAPWFGGAPEVAKTGKTYPLYATHDHWTMENRDLVRSTTLSDYQAHPNFAQETDKQPSLLGSDDSSGYAWGLSINLNTCIGCNACVVACQAENNIPTVGKEGVGRSREMHWIRIDRYFKGPLTDPKVVYQPVTCMQCEKAPCEPVCPAEATSHSAEGLNEMTYNRCVGTRYCSNNCPYKVRRFNFFKYNDETVLPLWGMRNPDVTVRSRGVMEKCTYCVQRINKARITAEVAGRKIADGEIRTACQQVCPTNAIVFGDINDPNSAVRKLKDSQLDYSLLAELGTRPRTTYMAQVKNPNPLIKDPAQV